MSSNYPINPIRVNKQLKRKAFFSNEAKKALLIAYLEARDNQTYVDINYLLYGLLAQPKSLSSQLFSLVASQFRNNVNVTNAFISNRLRKINQEKLSTNLLKDFSSELFNENKKTPWLTLEVKDILRSSIRSALQENKKVVVVTTKHLFFELLNKENIRSSLRSLVD